jgi:hypothetical protein
MEGKEEECKEGEVGLKSHFLCVMVVLIVLLNI